MMTREQKQMARFIVDACAALERTYDKIEQPDVAQTARVSKKATQKAAM